METSTTRPRWRWAIHLALLTAYPLMLGILGAINQTEESAPMLPTEIPKLLRLLAADFGLFLAIFGLAVGVSRPSARELFLNWNDGARPVARGFIYSIVLRGALFVLVLVIAVIVSIAGGGSTGSIAEQLRPETENLVDAKALASHPAYFAINATLVSFVFAGFREELWRAGMVAGFVALWAGVRAKSDIDSNAAAPSRTETAEAVPASEQPAATLLKQGLNESGDCRRSDVGPGARTVQFVAVLFAAVVFGLGHLPQGWGGVLMTAVLGMGLGLIMVRYGSIWEAVLAHGFFNATTFVLLYLLVRFWPGMVPGA